jgi:hypothetical protein
MKIPQEEPKQGTMSEAIKQVVNNQLKQETFEEVAKNNAVDNWLRGYNHLNLSNFDKNSIAVDFGNGWDMAIEWQQKQDKKLYSEEEVEDLILRLCVDLSFSKHKDFIDGKVWFEQFKKNIYENTDARVD